MRPARIFRSAVSFDIDASTPQRELSAAAAQAEASARAALPGPGLVRAEGALASAKDGRRKARFELTVSGDAATDAWSPLAADAFARAFEGALAARGRDPRRVA